MTNSALLARAKLDPDDAELVDVYAAEYPQHAYHVVAAFVLAGLEPPHAPAYSGTQARLIQDHYTKYTPNGVDDDGLAGVGALEVKR